MENLVILMADKSDVDNDFSSMTDNTFKTLVLSSCTSENLINQTEKYDIEIRRSSGLCVIEWNADVQANLYLRILT